MRSIRQWLLPAGAALAVAFLFGAQDSRASWAQQEEQCVGGAFGEILVLEAVSVHLDGVLVADGGYPEARLTVTSPVGDVVGLFVEPVSGTRRTVYARVQP